MNNSREDSINSLEYIPKISIIMPSYNHAKFIERSILSILNQDYSNLELIVVDGGSTDKTCEIIKKYDLEEIQNGNRELEEKINKFINSYITEQQQQI
jgi:glycosyltransferase involved in cell wall biosynthesis